MNSSSASKAQAICKCGFECPIWTSNKPNSRGKKFFGCPLYKVKEKYCGYFQWCDDALPDKIESFNFEDEKVSSLRLAVMEAKFGELEAVKKMEIKALEFQLQMKEKDIKVLEFKLQMFKLVLLVIVCAFVINLCM